jgi:hypothetical protein
VLRFLCLSIFQLVFPVFADYAGFSVWRGSSSVEHVPTSVLSGKLEVLVLPSEHHFRGANPQLGKPLEVHAVSGRCGKWSRESHKRPLIGACCFGLLLTAFFFTHQFDGFSIEIRSVVCFRLKNNTTFLKSLKKKPNNQIFLPKTHKERCPKGETRLAFTAHSTHCHSSSFSISISSHHIVHHRHLQGEFPEVPLVRGHCLHPVGGPSLETQMRIVEPS